jgi:hypothetical protein
MNKSADWAVFVRILLLMLKKIAAVIFMVILACYFLPFVTFSYNGETVGTLNGLQMTTGAEVNTSGWVGLATGGKKQISGSVVVGIAFSLAAIGLSTNLLLKNKHQSSLLPAIASGLGAIILLIVKSVTDDTVFKEGAEASYGLGFYLGILLFVVNAGLHGYQFVEEHKRRGH